MSHLGRTVEERFWSKVDKGADDSACWTWTGALNGRGYGQIVVERKKKLAHRLAWEMVHGEIPGDLTVHHQCYTPSCVRVAHLALLPGPENSRDNSWARRSECSAGHPYPETPVRAADGHRECLICRREYYARRKERVTNALGLWADVEAADGPLVVMSAAAFDDLIARLLIAEGGEQRSWWKP